MDKPILAVVAVAALVAAVVWGRSAQQLQRVWHRIEDDLGPGCRRHGAGPLELPQGAPHRHALRGAGGGGGGGRGARHRRGGATSSPSSSSRSGLSVLYGRDFRREARLAEDRSLLERRAEEVLSQEELAPRRWAARLAPEDLPDFAGFELGRVYQAGTGLMAGDFYDVFRVAPTRIAAVIGDVTGHGIEPSITAFQAKYLLRVFLRQYRDPAQALEELNRQMSALERVEEFISICVVVFDTEAATLRVASAGHPAAWLWHDREVRPLPRHRTAADARPRRRVHEPRDPARRSATCSCSTPTAWPRPAPASSSSARTGWPTRCAATPACRPTSSARSLLEAARDFATEPMTDDVAILAIKRA